MIIVRFTLPLVVTGTVAWCVCVALAEKDTRLGSLDSRDGRLASATRGYAISVAFARIFDASRRWCIKNAHVTRAVIRAVIRAETRPGPRGEALGGERERERERERESARAAGGWEVGRGEGKRERERESFASVVVGWRDRNDSAPIS